MPMLMNEVLIVTILLVYVPCVQAIVRYNTMKSNGRLATERHLSVKWFIDAPSQIISAQACANE